MLSKSPHSKSYASSFTLKNALKIMAAKHAPIRGAKINTHTWAKASPPAKNAGARLLAGFTEVPVKGIPIICTKVRVSPITKPAICEVALVEVTPRMVMTNTKVRTI